MSRTDKAISVIIRICGKALWPDRDLGLWNWFRLPSVSGIVPVEPSNAALT
jgi:hypothetical protein